jgi:hypothetical protein
VLNCAELHSAGLSRAELAQACSRGLKHAELRETAPSATRLPPPNLPARLLATHSVGASIDSMDFPEGASPFLAGCRFFRHVYAAGAHFRVAPGGVLEDQPFVSRVNSTGLFARETFHASPSKRHTVANKALVKAFCLVGP